MIISDSSPLITLAIIGKLDLPEKLFKDVFVPHAVYEEVLMNNKPFSNELKQFLFGKVKHVQNEIAVDILLSDIGKGNRKQ